jgi:hypothetical protein
MDTHEDHHDPRLPMSGDERAAENMRQLHEIVGNTIKSPDINDLLESTQRIFNGGSIGGSRNLFHRELALCLAEGQYARHRLSMVAEKMEASVAKTKKELAHTLPEWGARRSRLEEFQAYQEEGARLARRVDKGGEPSNPTEEKIAGWYQAFLDGTVSETDVSQPINSSEITPKFRVVLVVWRDHVNHFLSILEQAAESRARSQSLIKDNSEKIRRLLDGDTARRLDAVRHLYLRLDSMCASN